MPQGHVFRGGWISYKESETVKTITLCSVSKSVRARHLSLSKICWLLIYCPLSGLHHRKMGKAFFSGKVDSSPFRWKKPKVRYKCYGCGVLIPVNRHIDYWMVWYCCLIRLNVCVDGLSFEDRILSDTCVYLYIWSGTVIA